jgi:hypothetical protein
MCVFAAAKIAALSYDGGHSVTSMHKLIFNFFGLLISLALTPFAQAKDIYGNINGGGKISKAAMKAVVDEGGGANAHALILTWPSETAQLLSAFDLRHYLLDAGVRSENIRTSLFIPDEAHYPQFLKTFIDQMKNTTVLVLSGGDQERLTEFLTAHPEIAEMITHKILIEKASFSVTSASTAFLSKLMFSGRRLIPGFNLFAGILGDDEAFDQHFDTHTGRWARVIAALKSGKLKRVFAADEDVGFGFRSTPAGVTTITVMPLPENASPQKGGKIFRVEDPEHPIQLHVGDTADVHTLKIESCNGDLHPI